MKAVSLMTLAAVAFVACGKREGAEPRSEEPMLAQAVSSNGPTVAKDIGFVAGTPGPVADALSAVDPAAPPESKAIESATDSTTPSMLIRTGQASIEIDKLDPKKVRRVIVCSGKIYYELLAYRRERKIDDIVILRLEQQYPFPHEDYKNAVGKYAQAKEVVWCQEEPQNQGAWYRLNSYMRADIDNRKVLAYAGRPVSASPAVGYAAKHNAEQKQLIEDAFADKLKSGEMVLAR